MGLLTKYVFIAQLIVIVSVILLILVFRGVIPSNSAYSSYSLAIMNILLLIIVESVVVAVFFRKKIIYKISNSIKKSTNESMQMQMQMQMHQQNQNNSGFQKGLSSFTSWILPSQPLESIQITPGLISQINGVIDHATRDIVKLV